MNHQPDLFEQPRRYPSAPGFKERTTSREAARRIEPRAIHLRDRVFGAFLAGPATADEVAKLLGETVLSVRPRVTELSKLKKIERTGERRRNESGMSAAVWRAR